MVTVCFNVSIDYHWLPLYSPMMSCCARITFIFKESLHWEKFTVIFRPASSNRYLEEVHWGQRDTRHQEPSQCYQYYICEAAVLQRQDSQVSQGELRAAHGLAVEFVGCSCQTPVIGDVIFEDVIFKILLGEKCRVYIIGYIMNLQ